MTYVTKIYMPKKEKIRVFLDTKNLLCLSSRTNVLASCPVIIDAFQKAA